MVDGKCYMIDPANKVYCYDETGESATAFEDMTFSDISGTIDAESVTGANKVTIQDVEFDRYLVENETGTMYYYFENGTIRYGASLADTGNMLMIINEMSATANADLLKLPEDYREVTVDEYTELVYGDLLGEVE